MNCPNCGCTMHAGGQGINFCPQCGVQCDTMPASSGVPCPKPTGSPSPGGAPMGPMT